ncbi:MAG TPA: alpha/beta fold hydrolase [Vicinamibacterales bacterium]|nr:alpha/beta fold hydrolase [Vicinamibacterales bacterium]
MNATHRRRLHAAALLAAVLAAACSSNVTARDPATLGQLVEESCGSLPVDGARCARLAVRENRADPRSRTIGLRIVTLAATGPTPASDPIFLLAGGPGQAASELLGYRSIADPALRRRRDLVFADQRGTGGSNALTCRFYGPDTAQSYLDAFLPLEKVRACRAELERRADLSQYTTAASVEDLEEIRAALGYERINLVGGSYGTRLAMEYARRHEERVRAIVLDGPVPPSARMPENFGSLAERSLDLLLDECVADAECARRFGDVRAHARGVFERLRRAPVTATVMAPGALRPATVTLTRDHVAEAVRYMTYSAREASRVPLALHEAARGDYGSLAQFLLRWRSGGTFDGLYLSITCAEDVPFVSPDAAERDESTYLGGYRVRQQRAACAEWPRGAVPDWHGQPVHSDLPVLIISGELDPVTPPSHGEEVARTLPNSLHIRVPFAGHSPHGLDGLACLDGLTREFIERGSVNGLDASCVATEVRRAGFDTQ